MADEIVGSPSDTAGLFSQVISGVGDLAKTYYTIEGQKAAIDQTQSQTEFNRFMNSLNMTTAKSVAGSQAMTAQAQAQGALQSAQAKANPYNNVMLITAVVGAAVALVLLIRSRR
jgi:hypothetical protein